MESRTECLGDTVAGTVLQETFSVIGDPATSMRDPMFYRLHSFVDDMFQEHKATLPRYDTNRVSDPDHEPCNGIVHLSIRIV